MVRLYEAMMVPFTKLTKLMVSDGEGGWDTTWVESYDLPAAVNRAGSDQATRAEAPHSTDVFNVTIPKDHYLAFHDVIRRKSDGKTFRMTSSSMERATPGVATFEFRRATAEEWDIPEGDDAA